MYMIGHHPPPATSIRLHRSRSPLFPPASTAKKRVTALPDIPTRYGGHPCRYTHKHIGRSRGEQNPFPNDGTEETRGRDMGTSFLVPKKVPRQSLPPPPPERPIQHRENQTSVSPAGTKQNQCTARVWSVVVVSLGLPVFERKNKNTRQCRLRLSGRGLRCNEIPHMPFSSRDATNTCDVTSTENSAPGAPQRNAPAAPRAA